MHDGPGGILEYHEDDLERMAGTDLKKRDRMTWAAWVKPKAAENQFIYALLSADCHVILCMRAKEKIKIVKGKDPVDLGWQPIVGDRVAFETIFTLTLPPHSKGVPDLAVSEMREPFDSLIPLDQQLDEKIGVALAEWAAGGSSAGEPSAESSGLAAAATDGKSGEQPSPADSPFQPGEAPDDLPPPEMATEAQRKRLFAIAREYGVSKDTIKEIVLEFTGQESTAAIPRDKYDLVVATVEAQKVPA